MGVRMSREEAFAFLAASHTGILTSLRRDGAPVALPVWFVAADERVYVATPARTRKVARIRNDDRVSFLAETGERWAELQAVHLNGRARFVEDETLQKRIGELLDEKYAAFRTRRKAMPSATAKHYAVERAFIEIVPDDRLLSWDNRRLKLEEDPS